MESYDPILNPVLNREVRRTGGRVLITLGDQDIDLSPAFTIFLSTRDPSVRPSECSVTSPKSLSLLYLLNPYSPPSFSRSPSLSLLPLLLKPSDSPPLVTPQVEFAPDLCSRVTFVNFTVTRSSLQSQCLNRVRETSWDGGMYVFVCLLVS